MPLPAQADDAFGRAQADSRDFEDHGIVGRVDVHGEQIRLPLEAQETSYLAAPARISSLFWMFIPFTTY
jgi:hypothetical protein